VYLAYCARSAGSSFVFPYVVEVKSNLKSDTPMMYNFLYFVMSKVFSKELFLTRYRSSILVFCNEIIILTKRGTLALKQLLKLRCSQESLTDFLVILVAVINLFADVNE